MPTLTVKIAASGTTIDSNGSSLAGHIWLSIDSDGVSGSSAPVSLGFAPKDNQFGPLPLYQGDVHTNDDTSYRFTYYTGTISISDTQYSQLDALKNPGALEATDFNSFYTVGVNDCISFVYWALNKVGISAGDKAALLPAGNAEHIDQVLYTQLFGNLDGWQPGWSTQGNYNVTFGSDGDDTLKAGTSDIATITDVIYGGAGNDTITGIIADEKLYGGADNDTLIGNGGNDTLNGGDGDDSTLPGTMATTYWTVEPTTTRLTAARVRTPTCSGWVGDRIGSTIMTVALTKPIRSCLARVSCPPTSMWPGQGKTWS
jgi:RTX calcium-binding nonapeptide repeat (4 copies)